MRRKSVNFTNAIHWVSSNYPDLYVLCQRITLVPKNNIWYGLYLPPVNFCPMASKQVPAHFRQSSIWIARYNQSIGRYIETIVHELTHAAQDIQYPQVAWLLKFNEDEAEQAGREALQRYLTQDRRPKSQT